MLAKELRQKYIDFFVKKHDHRAIPGSSLLPENDPTVLFTTAGMHPLVPYLLGEKHPEGKRLVDVQKCVRTDDIEEVGDPTHCTFFEMLGNWSLGDYFKAGAIQMSYEFLTEELGLKPERLMVTCFAGDDDAPRDNEAAEEWKKHGFTPFDEADEAARSLIFFYEKKKNWWGPAGQTGPCGPDTEMFYDMCPEFPWAQHKPGSSEEAQQKYPLADGSGRCHANCECGRYVEIWNDVFMQYFKNEEGVFEPLKQQNVDTGMGLERVTAILQGKPSHYETELFEPMMTRIRSLAKESNVVSERIIADHIRSAVFIIGDERGVTPSNHDQGYVLRKLIRRAIRHGRKLGIEGHFAVELAQMVIGTYGDFYKELMKYEGRIVEALTKEEEKFMKTLENGIRELKKIFDRTTSGGTSKIDGKVIFHVYETFGLPPELSQEIMQEWGLKFDEQTMKECNEAFDKAFQKHQELSRAGSEQKFAGGLADHSFETKKLHTATHLMLEALRRVLGKTVEQKGSNITQERLRFDFNYPDKLTAEQITQVEKIVNDAIQADYPVHFEEMSVEDARKIDATGVFVDKYEGELAGRVKVYFMGDYSKEICGGPHVDHTGQLGGHFKIVKEESSSSGIRRVKAILE